MDEFFSVLRISRDDVKEVMGDKAQKLDDGEMKYIARKLGEGLMEYYWDVLKEVVEWMDE